jgi:aryl-alcohol dehydrogenase-like predicted oxidoreductase
LRQAGAALAYVLQGGLVDIALTTTTNAARLAQSLGAARRPLDASVMARIARFALDPAGGRS